MTSLQTVFWNFLSLKCKAVIEVKLLLYQIYMTGSGKGFCAPNVVEAFKIAGKIHVGL